MARGKNYRNISEKIGQDQYTIDGALALLCEHKSAKFDESVEVHAHLAIDTKKSDQSVRGSVVLPHGTGKQTRVGVITESKADDAKKAGADVIGGEDLIAQIIDGKLPDVDILVATPDIMPKLAKAAKVLGPRGLMPSPKTETVTPDVAKTVGQLKKGKESFRNDDGGNVHQIIGKVSFGADKLSKNYGVFIDALRKTKTDAHKGKLIGTLSLCSTMSPSIKVKN